MYKTSIQFTLRLGNNNSPDTATQNRWLSQDYLAFWNLFLDASAALPGCRRGRSEIKWPENERGKIYRKLPAPCTEEESKENNGEHLLWWTERRRKMIPGMVNKDRKQPAGGGSSWLGAGWILARGLNPRRHFVSWNVEKKQKENGTIRQRKRAEVNKHVAPITMTHS